MHFSAMIAPATATAGLAARRAAGLSQHPERRLPPFGGSQRGSAVDGASMRTFLYSPRTLRTVAPSLTRERPFPFVPCEFAVGGPKEDS
jgi:hypothetical protein